MNNTSTVTSKGQIVIPAALRKKLGLKPGTRVRFSQNGNDIVIHPQTPEYFDSFVGIWGTDDKELKLLLAERKKDRIREDKKLKKHARTR